MKKFIVFFSVLLLIGSLTFFQKGQLVDFCFANNATYVLILSHQNLPSNEQFIVTQNGNGLVVKTQKNNARKLLNAASNFVGEAWEIEGQNQEQVVKEITKKLNLKVIGYEQVNSITVLNAYTSKIGYYVLNGNEKQNVQIAMRDNFVVVGSPLILHSF